MMGLCPECAHVLYGYPNCSHHFQNGRCVHCYWDGSKSMYIKKQNQQEETDMPTTEWLNKYEAIKDRLTCKDDLEAHFTEKVIGNMAVDVLDIGALPHRADLRLLCWPSCSTSPSSSTIPLEHPESVELSGQRLRHRRSRWRSARKSLSAMSWA